MQRERKVLNASIGHILGAVFLPGEFHGWKNLAGYSPWDRKESGMTEQLTHTHTYLMYTWKKLRDE